MVVWYFVRPRKTIEEIVRQDSTKWLLSLLVMSITAIMYVVVNTQSQVYPLPVQGAMTKFETDGYIMDVPMDGINRSFLFSGLLASVIGVLVGMWISRSITAPVTALTKAARNMMEGQQPTKLPVKSRDELGQMSEVFNSMIDALDEQRTLRSRLMNDVAHEMNTPLSVIQLELDALRDGLQGPDDAASHIQQEVKHLRNVIDDLIWLSKTYDGELQLDAHPIDLGAETKRLVEHWKPVAKARGVELSMDISFVIDRVQYYVNADTTRIAQVFHNIIDNALRYTQEGGKIVVSMSKQMMDFADPANGKREYVVTRVQDNGIGIPEEDLPHIFERFYRVDASRSRQNGGRGLGLAIVRRIIEGYGGKVWAESQYQQGTTIIYALPGIKQED